MRVAVVTPPAPVVTWEQAAAHLKLDANDPEKTYIIGLVAAATAHIDGPRGWLGRAIGVQTLDVWFDDFSCGSFKLPYPELIGITSINWIDPAGTTGAAVPGQYELRGRMLGSAWGQSWPATRNQFEAVRIRYQAGFQTLPDDLRAAILLMTADLFENRSSVAAVAGVSAVPTSTTVQTLLAPYVVYD